MSPRRTTIATSNNRDPRAFPADPAPIRDYLRQVPTKPKPKTKRQAKQRTRGAQPANANAVSHNVYSKHMTADEIARFLAEAFDTDPPDLRQEIALARVVTDRIAARLRETRTDDELFQSLARLALEATGRIGNLLRQQRIIGGSAADSLSEAIAAALDEIGERLETQL